MARVWEYMARHPRRRPRNSVQHLSFRIAHRTPYVRQHADSRFVLGFLGTPLVVVPNVRFVLLA